MNENLEKYQNIHRGERAFVVGSAPSLLNLDMTRLQGEILFGSNQIYRFYFVGLPPVTYWHVGDRSCIPKISMDKKNGFSVENVGKKFYRTGGFDNFIGNSDLKSQEWILSHPDAEPYMLDGDLSEGCDWTDDIHHIRHGWSITFESMALAMWMGCNPIYLIGVDCCYPPNSDGARCFSRDKVLTGHKKVRNFIDKTGKNVYNAGYGGSLESYGRIDYSSLWDVK